MRCFYCFLSWRCLARRYGGGFGRVRYQYVGNFAGEDAVSSRLKARSREAASKKPRLPGETK